MNLWDEMEALAKKGTEHGLTKRECLRMGTLLARAKAKVPRKARIPNYGQPPRELVDILLAQARKSCLPRLGAYIHALDGKRRDGRYPKRRAAMVMALLEVDGRMLDEASRFVKRHRSSSYHFIQTHEAGMREEWYREAFQGLVGDLREALREFKGELGNKP